MMQHIHLIGIGGAGLSAIAKVLLERGFTVSGSDRQVNSQIEYLKTAGAQVYIGHAAENIHDADLIIRSSAIQDDNPEVVAARTLGIEVQKRIDFLSELTRGKQVIAVAGTHGKTTTTAMIAWVLTSLGLDPSFIIGSTATNLGTNAHAGNGAHFVIEADEYDHMFLGLSPKMALITNIEHDHPDCYATPENYYQAFYAFAQRIIPGGCLVLCADDPQSVSLEREINQQMPVVTYGINIGSESLPPAYQATQLKLITTGGYSFYAQINRAKDSYVGKANHWAQVQVRLRVPGEHNVRNALGALAIGDLLNLPLDQVAASLGEFLGTSRRFEVRGEVNGITVIDDYAHHPTEIKATLLAARARFPEQVIWAVWQPHTYSRTRLLANQFARAFGNHSNRLADHVLVTKIFAAREPVPADNFSSQQLVSQMAQESSFLEVSYLPELSQVTDHLLKHMHPGDVLLVFSAGDADQISTQVLQGL